MQDIALIKLSAIVVIGIGSTLLAHKLRLPSILLLLLSGFLLGPITGFIQPDELFGEIFFPFISLSVAVILFEGGLNLRLRDIHDARQAVFRLVVFGAMITWALSTVAAIYILNMPFKIALLLGAILIVTGPTVIMPLMLFIRPTGRVNAITKWEGIVNDPVGAIIAVLVYEVILASEHHDGALPVVLKIIAKTIIVGGGLGFIGSRVWIRAIRKKWIPDFLENPVTLMMVVGLFTLSNILSEESGLLTVTLMGILLANQKKVSVRHILVFKEELRVLLIAILFVVLSARLEVAVIKQIGFDALIFLAVSILIIRPVVVFLSTRGTELDRNEQLFLSWMAPRGIVAVAVASIFSLELSSHNIDGVEKLLPAIFVIIVGTVIVYGLSARSVAIKLGLASESNQGVLFVGAQTWARELGKRLMDKGLKVVFVDTNRQRIRDTKLDGLTAYQGSILEEHMLDKMDLSGIGTMVALTANDEVNALAALHCAEVFGRDNVYHLPSGSQNMEGSAEHLKGQIIGEMTSTYSRLNAVFVSGGEFKITNLSENFSYSDFEEQYTGEIFPLFIISRTGRLLPFNRDKVPVDGSSVVALTYVNS